jgi:NAD(P)-dependent dehydrogenase (short-subunit alcohol dehydrogenase family)
MVLATAHALAQMRATLSLWAATQPCAAVVSEIKHISGNDAVEALIADLSIMAQVRHVADQFKAKYQKLHVLVNNAGGAFGKRQVTAEGFEKTFALNHLNYFLLTNLLLDTLKASAPARIINVSSDFIRQRTRFRRFAVREGQLRFHATVVQLAVVFSYEPARRLAGTGVTNVLHLGLVRTGFANNISVRHYWLFHAFCGPYA